MVAHLNYTDTFVGISDGKLESDNRSKREF